MKTSVYKMNVDKIADSPLNPPVGEMIYERDENVLMIDRLEASDMNKESILKDFYEEKPVADI